MSTRVSVMIENRMTISCFLLAIVSSPDQLKMDTDTNAATYITPLAEGHRCIGVV